MKQLVWIDTETQVVVPREPTGDMVVAAVKARHGDAVYRCVSTLLTNDYAAQAVDENDAKVKGYRVWRNEFGHSHVTYIAEIDEPEAK